MRPLALLLLISTLCLPSAWGGDRPSPRKLAKQSAIVIVMCEDGGKSPAGRTIEKLGRRLLAPFVRPYYTDRTWLSGADATKKNVLDAIGAAAQKQPIVDVVLFVHGTKNKTHFADGYLTGRQLAKGLKSRLRGDATKARRLRMVYTTACFSDTVLDDWAEVAYACRGMSGVNRPLDFPRFFLGWIRGETYHKANKRSFEMNKCLQERYNRMRPRLVAGLSQTRDRLQQWEPSSEDQRQMKATGEDMLRLALKRWFREQWDAEHSRPRITGPDARIDRPVPAKLERKKGEDGHVGRRVVYY